MKKLVFATLVATFPSVLFAGGVYPCKKYTTGLQEEVVKGPNGPVTIISPIGEGSHASPPDVFTVSIADTTWTAEGACKNGAEFSIVTHEFIFVFY